MAFNKYYSVQALVKQGRELAGRMDVVSFDLFDTLLVRRIHDPDLVKLPVARFIAAKAAEAGLCWPWQKVQKLRDAIEKRHRAEAGGKFVDHEACYPRFMLEMLREIFGEEQGKALLPAVTEYELFMENSMLVPRREMLNWLRELAGQGKKIFIISDIYLPAEHLGKLVRHAGFLDAVEAVNSSADTFLAKASGLAFPLIEKKYKLDRKTWLHVGDNPISDGLRPSEFGIDALVLHDAAEKHRKAVTKRYVNYSGGLPFWRGRALQQLMQPHEGENVGREDLYIEGYAFLAPLIGGFVQHIAEQCRSRGISKVFFLSREGWTFKRFWEKSMPALFPDGRLPAIDYLYVSRMALAGASCAYRGLSRANADIAFLPPGNRDFRDLCRIFSLDIPALVPHLERHDLAADTCLSPLHQGYDPWDKVRFYELLEDAVFQEEIRRQTLPANQALQRYLADVGFFDYADVAIVDIGWLGTIQRFLFEAVQHRTDTPNCHGFLFGATRGIPYPTSAKNTVEGVLYDRQRFDMAGSTILYARDLFEEACRAPHPTLNAYLLTGDGYRLQFRDTDDDIGQAELEQDGYFAPLQQGIFDAAERYGAASALLGYSLEDYKPWFNYLLVSKLAFPKTAEVANIRHKHHLDDFHGRHVPNKVHVKGSRHLWDSSLLQLSCNPLLRLKYFLRHLRERIKE
jgi:FMN phosphatase YigB (HAD superfamily)